MIRELNENEVDALHYELLWKHIFELAKRIPPFPDVVWKVTSLIKKAAPIKEIEAVIKYDQAIAAKVLSLSQSVYYRRRSEVSSIQEAILVLGGQKLLQVIMTVCADRYFQGKISGHQVNDRDLWQHSVAVGIMGETIARRLKHRKVLSIYTASLLHDIGKTILDLYAKIYLNTSLRRMRNEGITFIEAERRAIGIDHQELGEIIALRWRFPPEVVVAIGHHHSPQKAQSDRDMASIVYVANRIVGDLDEDNKRVDTLEPAKDAFFKQLGIDDALVVQLKSELTEAMASVRQQLKN
jgi:putative nucleotidyltransferase with HDIG domain